MAKSMLLPALLLGGGGLAIYLATRKPTATTGTGVATAFETSSVVMQAQTKLQALGYYTGPIDGQVTQAFRDAVWGFQFDQQIAQTGELDNTTMQAIARAAQTAGSGGVATPTQGFGGFGAVGGRYAARF